MAELCFKCPVSDRPDIIMTVYHWKAGVQAGDNLIILIITVFLSLHDRKKLLLEV